MEKLKLDNIDLLNKEMASLTVADRITLFYQFVKPDEVLLTSSFGTSSGLLLYSVSKIEPRQKVHFIDTTYHFKETKRYKSTLKKQLKLKVVNVLPEMWANDFTREDKTWITDPDLCCTVNKIKPLEEVKKKYQYWISGLMRNQNDLRGGLNFLEYKDGLLCFYPLLDITAKEKALIWQSANLPEHPLLQQGYHSVGCKHCTQKGEGRSGRWAGKAKTECGIHFKPSN